MQELVKRQKDIWDREWSAEPAAMKTVPGHNSVDPTKDVENFYFKYVQNSEGSRILDIGAGTGRNSLFIAERDESGQVVAFDFSATSVEIMAKNSAHLNNFHVLQHTMGGGFPYQAESFDFGIDSLSSISIPDQMLRDKYVAELHRVMKIGGLCIVRVVHIDDEFERELMLKHPGDLPNSSIWPGLGKLQKNYSEEELIDFFEGFNPVELTVASKPAVKMGREFQATNLTAIFRKD